MKVLVIVGLALLQLTCFLSSHVQGLSESDYKVRFEEWIQKHEKTYFEEEILYRFKIFKQNHDFVEEFNSQNRSFTVGLNKFADMTNSEFLEKYTGLNYPRWNSPPHRLYAPLDDMAVPSSVDWRDKDAVTEVKDQGQCGSCWSFSTTGSVEGAWALNYSLVSLSEQNLIDCSKKYGNYGCNGGLMDNAFQYIIDNKGIDTEESYPYEEKSGSCRYNEKNKGASISDFQDVKSGSEDDLQNAVAYRGPVSVAIDASKMSFQLYKSGVYYEPRCSSTSLDHGVLTVGYGTGSDGDYWIVKNSWGPTWGDDGYIYMARNKDNNCGIATAASFPIV